MAERKVTSEIAQAMQADRYAGMSVSEVAAKYKVSEALVYKRTITPPPKTRYTPEFWAAVQADRDAGMKMHDLERKYKVGSATLSGHIDAHTPLVKHLDWEAVEPQMQADRDTGMSVSELGRKYGVSEYAVRQHTEDTFPLRWDYWREQVLSAGKRQRRYGH